MGTRASLRGRGRGAASRTSRIAPAHRSKSPGESRARLTGTARELRWRVRVLAPIRSVVTGVVTGATVVAGLACAGCASDYHPEYHPQSTYTVSQHIAYGPTIFQVGAVPAGAAGGVVMSGSGGGGGATEAQATEAREPADDPAPAAVDPSHVTLSDSPQLGRPGEVVGIVDLRVPAGTSREAYELQLKQRAARLGADAVIGVEVHPGERASQPTHVSGLAVRLR